ncbi:NU6M oxidoreductase, partial [Aegithalos caudatus]|nr:NU6M oxidoreductase [Aegithalos caudatus]
MINFVIFLGACFILGELAVASNPYYYGVVGLVLAFVAGCRWLMSPGTSFVFLVLFLVYLGRILMGFVYS